jgi:hypothetical protein
VRITNLITRVGWEARMALADHAALQLPNQPSAGWSATTRRRIEGPAEVLVRSLFMLDEHPLTAPVAGTSGFADEYAARGPRDRKGRSLYELELRSRLYRYRFSPLIYSEQFAGLPPEVLGFIHQRLQDVLRGRDRSVDFAKVSDQERAAILEILDETLAHVRGTEGRAY